MESSEKLEEKANRQRSEVLETAAEINHELSPGQLLDRFYFQGHGASFTGYMAKMKEDPVPGVLIGVAIAWAVGKEEIKAGASSVEEEVKDAAGKVQSGLHDHPILNIGLGFSIGAALAAMVPATSKEEALWGNTVERLRKKKDEIVEDTSEKIQQRLKH